MIRSLCCALAVTLIAVQTAQSQTDPSSALRPHPVTVIIQAVPWLLKDGHPTYFVTVRGYGRTTREARTEALRAAVDQAVGSVINSEREVHNSELRRSEVVQYASGYVDRYEVKSIRDENGMVAVTLDVWVKRSKLQDRLLGDHKKPGHIDNDRLVAQADTLDHSRKQGDLLLAQILRDFPARAYEIEQQPSRVLYGDDRTKRLELNFVVRWRHAYAESLRESLALVSQNANSGDCVGRHKRNCDYQGYVTIKARPGSHGWSRTSAFNDTVTMGLIRQNLIDSRPAVLFTFWDQRGRQIWRGCHRYSDLDNQQIGMLANDRLVQPTDQGILINTWINWAAKAGFKLDANNMPELDRYDIAIVRGDQCPN